MHSYRIRGNFQEVFIFAGEQNSEILSILKIYTVVTFAHAYIKTRVKMSSIRFTNRWSPDILIDMVSSNTSGKRKLLAVSHVHVRTQYSV